MKRLLPLLLLVLLPVLAVQAQTARTVLLEEATGTWCGYCPFGADTLNAILHSMSNTRGLAYHGGSASEPMRTTEGTAILTNMAVGNWPSAAVDRIIWNVGGNYQMMLSRSVWRQATMVRLANAPTSPCSITLTATYDSLTRVLTGTASVNALVAMPTGPFNINIILSENNLMYAQTFYPTTGGTTTLNPYYHKHVVRQMVTGTLGVQISAGAIAANTTLTHPFNVTIPAAWNVNEMDITVFVTQVFTGNNGNSRDIQATWQEGLRASVTFVPVELSLFRAQQTGADVELVWRTQREENNAGWHIERRTIDEDWKEIGFVSGAGASTSTRDYTFTDPSPAAEVLYSYRLRQRDYDGTETYSQKAPIYVRGEIRGFALMQNFPNPFNPSTSIEFRLENTAPVRVEIVDMLGRTLRVLADGEYTAGAHTLVWDAVDAAGAVLPSGMYLCRMTAPGFTATRTLHLSR
jgi:hypothetical protein